MIFRGNKPPIDTDHGPVLIIDEQSDHKIREISAKQFAHWGYTVFVAQDAGIGLSISAQVKPALVVMGEILEYMNTFSFLQELKTGMDGDPPPICILVGTWPYSDRNENSIPIVSISPIITVDEILDMSDDLCAA